MAVSATTMASGRFMSPPLAYCGLSTSNSPQQSQKMLRMSTLGSSLRGTLVDENMRIVRIVGRRLRGFDVCIAQAGIKKKSEEVVDASRLNNEKGALSFLTVSLPLGLATIEGLFLGGWIASLRGLNPGSLAFFAAADLVLSGIMVANCASGWYALEKSGNALKLFRKKKTTWPGWLDMGVSLGVSFIPFANLFLWLRFVSKQENLPAEARAALVANALIYEAPRLFALLFLFSGGFFLFLKVGLVSNLAFLLSAVHRVVAEARVKNENVLMEAVREEAKKLRARKPEKIVTAEEKERIARLKELEEFDMLLAQRSSPTDVAVLPARPKDWSVGETMEWLGQQGFARYATTFAENHIDGELLLQLTNDDLRDELQILSFGDRRKLELLIQQLKKGKG